MKSFLRESLGAPTCLWELPYLKVWFIYLCILIDNFWYIVTHFEKFCSILTCHLSEKQWGKLYILHGMLMIIYVSSTLIAYNPTLISSHLSASAYYNQCLISIVMLSHYLCSSAFISSSEKAVCTHKNMYYLTNILDNRR